MDTRLGTGKQVGPQIRVPAPVRGGSGSGWVRPSPWAPSSARPRPACASLRPDPCGWCNSWGECRLNPANGSHRSGRYIAGLPPDVVSWVPPRAQTERIAAARFARPLSPPQPAAPVEHPSCPFAANPPSARSGLRWEPETRTSVEAAAELTRPSPQDPVLPLMAASSPNRSFVPKLRSRWAASENGMIDPLNKLNGRYSWPASRPPLRCRASSGHQRSLLNNQPQPPGPFPLKR